jgi:hypothetical protein
MPEQARWPLLARPDMTDAMCAQLLRRPPTTVLVTGIAGAGKTTLLDELTARLRARHRRVETVVGVAELAAVPLGAFLPLLTRLTDPAAPVDERLRALLDQLGRDADRTVLLVDDASYLDEISAAAVYQLIRSFGVPAVVTVRTGTAVPGPIDRLLHEGAVSTAVVPSLTHDQMTQLLARRLGGSPTPELANALWERTDGNPLFLRGLVEGSLARTNPQQTDHGLTMTFENVADIGSLGDRAVGALGAAELRAAQLLALSGRLDPSQLDPSAIRQLEAAGLIAATDQGQLRLAHPLIADAARRSLREDRGERVQEASQLLADGDAPRRLAAVRLLVSAGIDPGAARLAEAASTAAQLGDQNVCDELATAAIVAGDRSASLRWVHGSALSLLGRLDAADHAFAEGWSLAATAEDRALGVSRHGEHLAFRRHDVTAALDLAEREAGAISGVLRSELDQELRVWRAIAGHISQPGAAPVSDESAPPAIRLRAAIASVLVDSLGGRGNLARESARAIAAIDRELGVLDPVASAMLHLEEFFFHLGRADGAAAWEVIQRQRVGALTDAAGIFSYTLAVFCWYDGRVDEGESLAALAVAQLTWRDPTGLLGAAVTLRALLTAAAGQPEHAAGLLAGLQPAQLQEPRAAMLHAEYGAFLLNAAGQPDAAAALLAEAGGGAVAAGYGLVGGLTVSFAIRLGRPGAVQGVLDSAAAGADPGNRLLPALRDLARALDQSATDDVLASAEIVAAAGMRATARDALRHAVATADPRARRRLAVALDRLAEGTGETAEEPTARELEVAALVAQRLSNPEIAMELSVSVRTVENHLSRFYAKTGATRRSLRAGAHGVSSPDGPQRGRAG